MKILFIKVFSFLLPFFPLTDVSTRAGVGRIWAFKDTAGLSVPGPASSPGPGLCQSPIEPQGQRTRQRTRYFSSLYSAAQDWGPKQKPQDPWFIPDHVGPRFSHTASYLLFQKELWVCKVYPTEHSGSRTDFIMG